MNVVEPIRDIRIVKAIAQYLKTQSERDYIMYKFGVYTGLRISDILPLRVSDVKNLDHVRIKEKKTGKDKRFIINNKLNKDLKEYIKDKEDYELLFPNKYHKEKPITRQRAYKILNDAAKQFNLQSIGTHTLRKTFGYHMYQRTHDAAELMDIFNHSSIEITLRYIGVNQDSKDKSMSKLDLDF